MSLFLPIDSGFSFPTVHPCVLLLSSLLQVMPGRAEPSLSILADEQRRKRLCKCLVTAGRGCSSPNLLPSSQCVLQLSSRTANACPLSGVARLLWERCREAEGDSAQKGRSSSSADSGHGGGGAAPSKGTLTCIRTWLQPAPVLCSAKRGPCGQQHSPRSFSHDCRVAQSDSSVHTCRNSP